ncbi:MAG: PQQ-binding-like beta-propeller repeat protein [Gammaproteobacteria bacterium]|nr:PQQ-binding-like beta-propeller repeat protein [Pseudomonadales bacterium]
MHKSLHQSAVLLLAGLGLFMFHNASAQQVSVERGGETFQSECSRCHVPAEMSGRLQARWLDRSAQELYDQIRQTMPAETPGSLSNEQYLDLTAFILSSGNVAVPATLPAAELVSIQIRPGVAVADSNADDNYNWQSYGGNLGSTHYAPLDQVDAENAADLEIAWSLDTGLFGPRPETLSVTTPLVVDGVMYATAGSTRNVVALDAVSGQLLWMWRPQERQRFDQAPRKGSGKGLAFFQDGDRQMVFTITPGYFLVALDARTGDPVASFGTGGFVDLQRGLRLGPGRDAIDIGISFPPFVIDDVVIAGAAHEVGMRPVSASNVKGDIRGFDARTGELLWTFKTIPEAGEPGSETWLSGAEYTGNAGVWAPMSGDPELGLVFLPVESATGDRYGGNRHGSNLFASSTVALDYRTGERKWHFQTTHHDIWDWDTPSAPIVADLPDGTPALIQTLKQSHLFAFNRQTGEPLFPVEERPVPISEIPGEWSSPTQPFPLLPAPYDRQGFQADDLVDFTPEIKHRAHKVAANYRFSELYTPPSLYQAEDGSLGTLHLPSSTGGSNWEGAPYDPETGLLYVPSRTATSVLSLVSDPQASSMAYIHGGDRTPSIDGIPLVKPPYGRITAIDMVSGQHKWQVVNGETPDEIANHPLLEGVELPATGKPTRSPLLLTKTLLFQGEGPGGDPVLWVRDKTSGEAIARIELPGSVTGVPMTYIVEGKQYLAMATSNFREPARIVVLALPD